MSVETVEYAAMMRRMMRAYARRVAMADPEDLTDLRTLAEDVEKATHEAVNGLRERGVSWARIGAALGITRQAAQQRFACQGNLDES